MFTNTDLVFVRNTVFYSCPVVSLYYFYLQQVSQKFPISFFLKLFRLSVRRYNVSCSLATSSHWQLPQEHFQELRPNLPHLILANELCFDLAICKDEDSRHGGDGKVGRQVAAVFRHNLQ